MRRIDTNRLIADYLSGNLNQKDVEELNRRYDNREGWLEFKKRIPAWRSRKPAVWKILSVAASIAIAVFFSYRTGTKNIQRQFTDTVIEIPNGSRTGIALPDGSTVFLNGGSRITYSQGFGITDRELSIDGEGFFEVARNENLPMRIKSENLSAEVLGTKFSYKDYGDETEAYVALTQGSVQVSAGEEMIRLVPGQAAILNTATGRLTIREDRNKELLVWREGGFSFDEASLETITNELSKAFGVSFTFESENLRSLCFYASFFDAEATCETILNHLSNTGAFNYTAKGKNITIKENRHI